MPELGWPEKRHKWGRPSDLGFLRRVAAAKTSLKRQLCSHAITSSRDKPADARTVNPCQATPYPLSPCHRVTWRPET